MESTRAIDKKGKASWRFAVLTAAGGLLIALAAIWGANKQILGLFHDDGIYAVVAQSISQGEGYRIISLPSKPPQTKYPFLYSYLLSWLWDLYPSFPQNIGLLKGLNSAILAAIFISSVALYRRYFPSGRTGALVFALLVCTNPIIFTYTDYLVSDLSYVALALSVLVLAHGWMDSPAASPKLSFVAVLTGLACLIRLAAAPLALAGAAWVFIERGWRAALYFCFTVFAITAPWLVWVYLYAGGSTSPLFAYYSAYDFTGATNFDGGEGLTRHWSVVVGNARYLLNSFDLLYLLPLMPWLAPFVLGLTVIGVIVSCRREDSFAWVFLAASAALLLVWPFHPGRYLAPLVPLFILFFFRGTTSMERWIDSSGGDYKGKPVVAKLVWAPVALVLLLNGVWLSSYFLIKDEQTTRGLYGNRVPYAWQGFEESFAWIRQNTKADVRLATAYDPMYFLYTGRQAIRPALHRPASYFYPYGKAAPDVGTVAEIKAELERLRIEYLIIDPLDGYAEGKATIRLLEDLVHSYGSRAINIFASSDGKHRIYSLSSQ